MGGWLTDKRSGKNLIDKDVEILDPAPAFL